MKIYFSSKADSFYRDDFHGTRLISIPDPDWVRPTISIPDNSWIAPLIEIPDPDWRRPLVESPNPDWEEGSADIPETILIPDDKAVCPVIKIPDPKASQPTVEVPDTSVEHPAIEVPNPKCLLPPEAELVSVTEKEHQEIINTIATGFFVLSSDKNGRPVVIPAPGQTADQILSGALLQRDRLMTIAATRIAPLQDAVDLDEATDAEVASLKKWKQYRVAVNRVTDQEGFPTQFAWPTEPK